MDCPNDDNFENCSKRRSSRSIKRRKFDDEVVESSSRAALGSSVSKTQPASTQTSNATITSLDSVVTPVPSILETIMTNTIPTPKKQLRKNPSFRKPINASTLTPVVSVPSTSINRSSRKHKLNKKKNSNKDLGRWKPTDDLILIHSVLQTNNLALVHKGIKFSCRFTLKEVSERWYALLYDSTISGLAISAMQNLHPKTIATVESKTLFSIAEEDLLTSIQSNSHPTLETFQKLFTENPDTFHRRRTPKILMSHWQLMKQYSLLSDQCSTLENPIPIPIMSNVEDRNIHILNNEQEVTTLSVEHIPTFAECEALINDQHLLNERPNPVLETQLNLTSKKVKREIKVLEYELPSAQVLVYPITGISPDEFESQTLAVLRGRSVKYLMRSKEIIIGRTSKYERVDVDLKLEGPAWKISRRQATIRLRNTGEFFIVCEGKKCLYVNGKPLLTGDRSRLIHNSVLEIAGLRFIFLINHQLIIEMKRGFIEQDQKYHTQHTNSKSQNIAVPYTDKPVQSEDANQNMQQQHQKLFEEMQKIFEEQEQRTKLLKDQEQNILQEQEMELEQQLQLLEAELKSTFNSNNISSELLN